MRFLRFTRNVFGLSVPLGCLAACGGSLAPTGDLDAAICGDDVGDAPQDAGVPDRTAPPPMNGPDASASPDATTTTDAASQDSAASPDATIPADAASPDAAPTSDGSSAATMIQATPGTELHSIAADDRSVVWVATGSTAGGSIWSAPVGDLASPIVLAGGAVTLTMDATSVYFGGETPQAPNGGFESTIWRVGRDGGAPVALTSGTGEAMAILTYAGTVYEEAYPDSMGGASIYAVGTDGTDPRTFAAGLPGLLSWAAQGADIYLGQSLNFYAIDELPLTGEPDGGLAVFLANYSATAITSDGTDLYFTGQNAVYSLATDAGAPVPLAWKLRSPYAIAVDDASVYWTDEMCEGTGESDGGCTGVILKLSPK